MRECKTCGGVGLVGSGGNLEADKVNVEMQGRKVTCPACGGKGAVPDTNPASLVGSGAIAAKPGLIQRIFNAF